MTRDTLILFAIALLALSWSSVNCQEEEAPYDINQGVMYKQFLDELFTKYDPENKKNINK